VKNILERFCSEFPEYRSELRYEQVDGESEPMVYLEPRGLHAFLAWVQAHHHINDLEVYQALTDAIDDLPPP
jgi:hypothetical protein